MSRALVADLVIASMFIQQGDDGLDVVLLDDVQYLGALDQNAVQHLQDACGETQRPRLSVSAV